MSTLNIFWPADYTYHSIGHMSTLTNFLARCFLLPVPWPYEWPCRFLGQKISTLKFFLASWLHLPVHWPDVYTYHFLGQMSITAIFLAIWLHLQFSWPCDTLTVLLAKILHLPVHWPDEWVYVLVPWPGELMCQFLDQTGTVISFPVKACCHVPHKTLLQNEATPECCRCVGVSVRFMWPFVSTVNLYLENCWS
jgi:hypothetical protein